jgi:CheY-like chemotaxis protein
VAAILVVDDEPGIREFVRETLEADGHALVEAPNGTSALARLRERPFDLVITDLRMPGGVDGMDVVREARATRPDTKVIVLTAHGSVSTAVETMKLGAHDFLEKPVSGPTELRILVSRVLGGADPAGAAALGAGADGAAPSASPRPDPLADRLQRALGADYVVEGRIGSGGYAVVFRVLDRRLDRRLAAKVLRPEFARSPETAERFRAEARTMARLSHPNLVPVYFVGRERDVPWFVMPFVDGPSLATLIERHGPLRMPLALRIGRDVAAALDFAHRMGVIHRDVKPENILIDGTAGRALLADFGIARAVTAHGGSTAPGMFIGTPRYASPEQLAGEPDVGARSDVYSFAVVMYQMLAGHVPFDGDNTNMIVAQHMTAPVPPLRELVPTVTRRADAVIGRALAKDSRDRFETAGAFVLALDVAAGISS